MIGGGRALSVGAVASHLGVSPSMVRSLEKLGLAKPARSRSRYRLYSGDDLQVLRRAVYLRRVQGLNAPAIVKQLTQEGLLHGAPGISPEHAPIGPRLRQLRLERGQSLSSVATAVGVSKGFLSNLERSRTGVSADILRKLARHYNVSILEVYSPIDSTGPLVRPRDRKGLESGPGLQVALLASGKIAMQPHLLRVAPGASSAEFHSHDGEEFLYLVRGRLDVELGGKEFQLRPGDAFYFVSKTSHRWRNPGKTKAVLLWINTPATL